VSPFSVVSTYLLTGLLHGCCTERCGTQLPLVAYLRSSPYLHRNDTTHGEIAVEALAVDFGECLTKAQKVIDTVEWKSP
jgi:hypothetical protein